MQGSYVKDLEKESPMCGKTAFKSLMVVLMQLYDVRPDIQYVVFKIAQRQEASRVHVMEVLLWIVLFLWYTRDLCLRIRCGAKEIAKIFVKLWGFSDCAYANHLNGRSQYSTPWQLGNAEDARDKLSPIDPERLCGLINTKS